MPAINREEFLRNLESIQPGISKQAILEQSDCIVFSNGQMATFNDELCCQTKGPLNSKFSGAVPAQKLLDQLRDWTEEEITVETTDTEMIIRGKNQGAGFRYEKDVVLAVDQVEKPKEWRKLPKDFVEAVSVVGQCAGRDESKRLSVCLHIHPDWVESADSHQCCRWSLETGLAKPTLVRQTSVRHIVQLGMHELAETPNWLHFHNRVGLVLSCRRFLDIGDFPSDEITKAIAVKGVKCSFPKTLEKALHRAAMASSDDAAGDDKVTVRLEPGKLKVRGQGVSHRYWKTSKLAYDGKVLEFQISPNLFIELIRRHTDYILAETKLRVDVSASCVYVTALSRPKEKE